MDYGEYVIGVMLKQRHRDLLAEAQRDALLRAAGARPRPLRAALGAFLIRWGAWLLRDECEFRSTGSRSSGMKA